MTSRPSAERKPSPFDGAPPAFAGVLRYEGLIDGGPAPVTATTSVNVVPPVICGGEDSPVSLIGHEACDQAGIDRILVGTVLVAVQTDNGSIAVRKAARSKFPASSGWM